MQVSDFFFTFRECSTDCESDVDAPQSVSDVLAPPQRRSRDMDRDGGVRGRFREIERERERDLLGVRLE